jgi:hypothetical protein
MRLTHLWTHQQRGFGAGPHKLDGYGSSRRVMVMECPTQEGSSARRLGKVHSRPASTRRAVAPAENRGCGCCWPHRALLCLLTDGVGQMVGDLRLRLETITSTQKTATTPSTSKETVWAVRDTRYASWCDVGEASGAPAALVSMDDDPGSSGG